MRNVLDPLLAERMKDTYVLIGLDAVIPCVPELWLSGINLGIVRGIIRQLITASTDVRDPGVWGQVTNALDSKLPQNERGALSLWMSIICPFLLPDSRSWEQQWCTIIASTALEPENRRAMNSPSVERAVMGCGGDVRRYIPWMEDNLTPRIQLSEADRQFLSFTEFPFETILSEVKRIAGLNHFVASWEQWFNLNPAVRLLRIAPSH